jgi:hypothetical protein
MPQIDLGQLRFFYLGEWDDSSLYETNDVVNRGANAYIYTAASSSSGSAFEPGISSNWEKFTSGIRFVGEWNAGESYLFGDVVTDTVNTWIATQNLTSAEEDESPGDNEAFIVFTSGTDNLPVQANKDNYLLSTISGSPVWVDEIQIEQANIDGKLYVGEDSEFLDENVGSGSASITDFSVSGSVVTVTTSDPHGFFEFQFVNIDVGDERFDGEYEISSVPSETTFTFESNVADGTYEIPGTVSKVAGYTNAFAVFSGEYDDFAQLAVINTGNDPNSSTDIIAYASNGDDFSGWIDMGITAQNFDDPEFTITEGNDGYIFMEAPAGTSGDGNLVIATGSFGQKNRIVFAAGGLSSDNRQMEIIPDESVVIEIDTNSTSPETGALIVEGGVGIQGNMNIQGNMDIQGEITVGGGVFQSDNLSVSDPIVFVNTASALNVFDVGLVGQYDNSGSGFYTGIVRDYTDGIWKFFENLETLPTTTIDFGLTDFASLQVSDLFVEAATFTGNVSISGRLDVAEIREATEDVTISSGSITSNYQDSNVFICTTTASANFTVNLTNVPTDNNKIFTLSYIITQGATGYIPNVFAIDGVIQTIKWVGGNAPTPTSSNGKKDIYNFTVFRRSDAFEVFGNATRNF